MREKKRDLNPEKIIMFVSKVKGIKIQCFKNAEKLLSKKGYKIQEILYLIVMCVWFSQTLLLAMVLGRKWQTFPHEIWQAIKKVRQTTICSWLF